LIRYEANIPIEPIGKARPRMTRSGHVYTPKKTVDFERVIQASWEAQTNNAKISGCYITAYIYAGFTIPKSWSKKKRLAAAGRPHTSKPDADNVAKAVLDALNHTAYDDDSSVTELHVGKFYAHEPYVQIILTAQTPEEFENAVEIFKEEVIK
jgi:Holliday junction resolvase RusA-like endonuclease